MIRIDRSAEVEGAQMHKLRRMAAGIAAAAALAVVATAVPALADPPAGSGGQAAVVPAAYDLVGVGANTDDNLFNQLTASYDAKIPAGKHSASHPYVYSWNALPPGKTVPSKSYKIVPKAGCAATSRPNGSGAGLKALDLNTLDAKTGHYCIDYARSSSGPAPGGPKDAPGGVSYVALATDAVTYATRDTGGTKKVPDTYAPKNLSLLQLKKIFTCADTNWKQVGGPNQPIKAYLPQTSSGTYSFWIKKLGITEQGTCVNVSLEENQGLSKQFDSPNAIFIYSVGDWIAQKYHSPLPGKAPTAAQNKFGTDEVGFLGLNEIDHISPITAAKIPTINPAFKSTTFTRTLYDIVRYTAKTPGNIPAALVPFFGDKKAGGYLCSNPTALAEIVDYGFIPSKTCGDGS
jgi:ABC-type phosphate transport system substrate-binding protein